MLERAKVRLLGAGTATIAISGATVGIENLSCALIQEVARNPSL